jgi:predicted AAA+ superfamily ATPase
VIARPIPLGRIGRALRRERVVALIGPRQSGKTTLARQIQDPRSPNYFDLEDPAGLALLDEPMTALSQLRGVIVIDEVQRRPDLFPVLRVLADRRPLPARFLILGSASPQLLRQSSETLAGRLETIVLPGFSLAEVEAKRLDRHWRRGGFPRSFLSRSEEDSTAWRGELVQTFLERDLPQMGITIPATTLLRFWTMLAHYHGAVWKASELARSLGTSEPTVRRYLDLLSGAFMVRQLPPWHENLRKRQVKSPKIYLRDTGILHRLLGIGSQRELLSHPKCGASWEGYAIEEVLKLLQPTEAYFWATHQGAELDLLLFKGGRRFGFEVKRADAPRITPSMRIALDDLELEHLTVLYPGDVPYELGERISVVPLSLLARLKADQLLPKRRRSRTQASRRSTPSTRR